MTGHMVIDFNGYTMTNSFRIKEYALCKFDGKTGEKTSATFHGIGRPFLSFKDLNDEALRSYETFFKQYGIEWETSTQQDHQLVHEVAQQANRIKYIFVRNKKQEELLRKFLDTYQSKNENTFFSLDVLGFLLVPRESTACPYHQNPFKNNCAKDNLEIMFRWLVESKLYLDEYRNKMHIVVDFNAYYMPYGSQQIKEFACQQMDEKGVHKSNSFLIVKPLIFYKNDLPDNIQANYSKYLRLFGIEWNQGTHEFYESQEVIRNFFKKATYVYVKGMKKKRLLRNYIDEIFGCNCKLEILCLDEFGYDKPMAMSTKQNHHINPQQNNCAVDNVTDMRIWLVKSQIYKIEVRNSYLQNLYKFVPKKKYKDYE